MIVDWLQTKADCRDETLPIKPSWFHLLPQSGDLRALTKTRRATLSARLDSSFAVLPLPRDLLRCPEKLIVLAHELDWQGKSTIAGPTRSG